MISFGLLALVLVGVTLAYLSEQGNSEPEPVPVEVQRPEARGDKRR